jgi:hypothetical protein
MFDPFRRVLFHLARERGRPDHFSNVLVDERVGRQVSGRADSEPFLFRLDNLDWCVFSFL